MWLWVVSRLPNRVLVGAPGGGQGVLVSLLAWVPPGHSKG